MLHKKWLSLNGLFAKSTQATKAKQNNNKKNIPHIIIIIIIGDTRLEKTYFTFSGHIFCWLSESP